MAQMTTIEGLNRVLDVLPRCLARMEKMPAVKGDSNFLKDPTRAKDAEFLRETHHKLKEAIDQFSELRKMCDDPNVAPQENSVTNAPK